MEQKFLTICRHPIEIEGISDISVLSWLCFEDLLLTAVPNTIFLFIGLSKICPSFVQYRNFPNFSISWKKILSLILQIWLSLFPIFQLYQLSLSEVAIYYILTESLSWLLSAVILTWEELKNLERSWILYTFWIVQIFSNLVKGITRLELGYTENSLNIPLALHLIEMISVLTAVAILIPYKTIKSPYSHSKSDLSLQHKIGVIGVMMNGQLIYGLAILIIPSYAVSIQVSNFSIGMIFSGYAFSVLIASPFFALLSVISIQEKIGRVSTMFLGSLCLGLSTLGFSLAKDLYGLLVSRVLQGLAAAANFAPALALVSDICPSSKLGKVLGEITAFSGIGMLVGPPIGGVLYHWYGYSFPFIIGGILCFLQAFLVLILFRGISQKQKKVDTNINIWRTEIFELLGVITVAVACLTMLEPILPLLLSAKFSLKPLEMGMIFAMVVASFGVVSPVAGSISDYTGRKQVMIVGLAVMGLLLPLIGVPESVVLETICLMLIGVSLALVLVPALPELASVVNSSRKTSYDEIYACFNSSYAVGNIVGPLIGGAVSTEIGLDYSFMALGIIIVIFSVVFYKRKHKEGNFEEKSLIIS